jgi:lipopolysaccharide transport system ATP-binding protein
MSETIIKVENLSKQYQLGQIGTGTLTRDLQRWYSRVRGKEDPTLKIGQENILSAHRSPDFVWALKDINFEVKQGEVLGIIGKNGAGKSTLLKILSQVTSPTTGEIKIKGRIASLLEVGTGFHPELTGRENIFLNGAILGMTKNEIRSKFDEIVDFSGVEKYIDTPVKRYSSGMYVRLAFAVAAHLEPEILVVDEVLAVGDAEFQNKCLGKMQDVSRIDGRTVLFVSHNMNAISKLCEKGIFLYNGELLRSGNINDIINYYISNSVNTDIDYQNIDLTVHPGRKKDYRPIASRLAIRSKNLQMTGKIFIGDDLEIEIGYKDKDKRINLFQVGIESLLGERILTIGSYQDPTFLTEPGNNSVKCIIPDLNLTEGKYSLTIMLGTLNPFSNEDIVYNACEINIVDNNYFQVGKSILSTQGKLLKKSKWEYIKYTENEFNNN